MVTNNNRVKEELAKDAKRKRIKYATLNKIQKEALKTKRLKYKALQRRAKAAERAKQKYKYLFSYLRCMTISYQISKIIANWHYHHNFINNYNFIHITILILHLNRYAHKNTEIGDLHF